jgi:glycosidase
MDEYPNFSMVGEEWSLNPLITSYWQKGKQNHDGYKSCLTSIMDFPLQSALVEALKEPEGADLSKGMTKLYEALANDFVYADPKKILVFGDNHDMDRLFTQLDRDVDLTKMALTYLLTIRGIPQIFYGTEILMDNTGIIRMTALSVQISRRMERGYCKCLYGKGLSAEQLSVQTYLRKLLNWRKDNPVIATGQTLHFAPFGGVYVYFRYTKDRMIMVLMNRNNTAANIDVKRFAENFKK